MNEKATRRLLTYLTLITIILFFEIFIIVLKLNELITWSWLAVTLPVIITLGIIILLLVIVTIMTLCGYAYVEDKDNKDKHDDEDL